MNNLKNKLRLLIIFIWMPFVLVASVFAEDISVSASLDRSEISLSEYAQLSITVTGTQDVSPFEFPPIDGFETQYIGPSRQFSMVNGKTSSMIVFVYYLYPQKIGPLVFPGLSMAIDGQTYTTSALSLNVVSNSQSAQSLGVSSNQSQNINDKVFLALKISQDSVYVNQQIPVKVLLFVNELAVRDIQYPTIDLTGFQLGEYTQPKQYRQNVEGRVFEVIEFDTFVYPTRTGTLSFGPAQMEANILYKQSSSRGRMGSLFDDDFFSDFFNRYEKRPINVKSQVVELEVLPLPEDGRPDNFSQGVGQFQFNMDVSPVNLMQGDPITIKLTVTGDGNLSAVTLPAFEEDDNFKVYEPSIKFENGTKSLEQVIIPKKITITEIPVRSFSYFDVNFKKYRTITKGPFPIEITESKNGEGLKVVDFNPGNFSMEEESFGQDIVFIKQDPGNLRVKGKNFYQGFMFYLGICAGLFGFGVFYLKHLQQMRLKTDIGYARRLRAPKSARKGIACAKELISTKSPEEFYQVIFKTMQSYLGDKFHIASQSVTFETVFSRLNQEIKDSSVIEKIKHIFSQCDAVRYAAGQFDKKTMQQTLLELEKIIDHLERLQ